MIKLLLRRLLPAAPIILLPAFVLAWTPYGYGPYDNPDNVGTPPAEPNAQQMPYPSMPSYGIPPYGTDPKFPGTPYGYPPQMPGPGFLPELGQPGSPSPFGTPGRQPRFTLSRSATSDAYILDIQLHNMEPTQVQIDIQGQWIRVGSTDTREDIREESFDAGRGFMRSYSYSSGSSAKRLVLPRDADPAGMTREDAAGSVRISIPRKPADDRLAR